MSTTPPPPTRRHFLGAAAALAAAADGPAAPDKRPAPPTPFEPVRIPEWVRGVTRMAYLSPDQVPPAARAGVEVAHPTLVWPYSPLRRAGGGLGKADARKLRALVADCHDRRMKLVLGLPPFPPVA